jgi:hypothetical protein
MRIKIQMLGLALLVSQSAFAAAHKKHGLSIVGPKHQG